MFHVSISFNQATVVANQKFLRTYLVEDLKTYWSINIYEDVTYVKIKT